MGGLTLKARLDAQPGWGPLGPPRLVWYASEPGWAIVWRIKDEAKMNVEIGAFRGVGLRRCVGRKAWGHAKARVERVTSERAVLIVLIS